MKKHIFRIMIVMLFACLGLTAFVACAPEENKETFTVTYVAGEGTGTGPASEKHAEGETFTVAENTFTYEGYTFKTWNDGTKDVAAGATYTMPAKDVTFTAKWTKNATPAEKVTVTYSLGDYTTGTAPDAQQVEKGAQVTLPEAPIWADHTFKGWKVGTDATLKQAGDKITVSENVTVTAQWEAAIEGYWTATGLNLDLPGIANPIDMEIALREDEPEHLYAVFKLTTGQTSYVDAVYTEKVGFAWQYYDYIVITLQDGKLHVKIQTVEIDLATRTAFTDEFTPTGTYSATVNGSEHYMDFDQWGYDSGNGYMDDVDFVTVGKYVAVFESTQDDELGSLGVLIKGESGAILEYNEDGGFTTFTACEAREKIFGADNHPKDPGVDNSPIRSMAMQYELKRENEKVYLYVYGTYEGYTPSEIQALLEDNNIDTCSISLYPNHTPWNPIFPNPKEGTNLIERTHIVGQGRVTAKLDITTLPFDTYGIASQNDGWGDLLWTKDQIQNGEQSIIIDKKMYVLGPNGGNAQLTVCPDWTGVSATPTGITLTLNDAKDKVLLTVSGTYTGCTPEYMEMLLSQVRPYPIVYFWGSDNNTQEGKDLVITTTDTNWTLQVDVTELKSDIYDNNQAEGTMIHNATLGDGINGRPNTSPGYSTEFQVQSVVDTTVECGGRAFTLVRSGLYGNNTIYVGTPVTITYDLGSWDGGTVPAPVTVAKGAKVTLPTPGEREGYHFRGWKVGTDETLKKAGEVIDATDVTVTAVWASDAVSGIWTYTKDGDTTKLYVENCEGGVIVVLETKSGKEAMFFAVGEDGWTCGSKTLTAVENSLVLKAEQTTTFTGRTAFAAGDTAEIPEGVYHYMAAEKEALYVDFGYEAIDLGEGYLDDAELATVGKFVVALVEKDGVKQGPVFEIAENGDITAYNATAMALTACDARAKNVVLTLFTLAAEGDKAYLTMSGTYVGFKPSELYQLLNDGTYKVFNPSVFFNHSPWTTYPNPTLPETQIVPREHTIKEGTIIAKLDITQLPYETYGLAPRNDGSSDCIWGSNTNQEIKVGNKIYTLSPSGSNAQLAITPDWTGVTAAVTSISLSLDNADAAQATKVLLTYEGTYSGCTKEAMKALLEVKYSGNTFFYFWGATSHADSVKDFTVTVEEGTWKIVIDVTDLPVETCRNLCGFFTNPASPNADLKYGADILHATDITFKGKIYHLVLENGWGNNGLNVEAVAE